MRIFLVAGEASSDMNAAAVVEELRRRRSDIEFFGVGGERLKKAGMRVDVSAEKISVVGLSDWAERWTEILDTYCSLRSMVYREQIDCALLLDLPDLNLSLAKRLKSQNIPVIYYTPPQVWAWRKYRVETIRKVIDRVLVVFPFEADFYRRENISAEFVGHPLRELVKPRQSFREQSEVERAPRIALLPGSRRSEVRNHAPILAAVAEMVTKVFPNAQIQVPVASTLSQGFLAQAWGAMEGVAFTDDAHASLAWADVAVVASGTATLETGIIGTPFCLLYKLSPTTSFFVKHVFRYREFFGLPNVLTGRKIVEEFLHGHAQPSAIAHEVMHLIRDCAYRQRMQEELRIISDSLGDRVASKNVADVVEQVLGPARGRG